MRGDNRLEVARLSESDEARISQAHGCQTLQARRAAQSEGKENRGSDFTRMVCMYDDESLKGMFRTLGFTL